MRVDAAKRLKRQAQAAPRPAPDPLAEVTGQELAALLEDELHALPDRYRLPFLLCYVEGQTRDQAARQLGWPPRTLQRRLDQGRELLRLRLTRRGVTLTAALVAAGLPPSTTAAIPPCSSRPP
jgi:DNA-directed RNA polymerase specialized sigma24 family protein